MKKRGTEVDQDFVLQYPVLTFGILGVILGFALLLCLFLLIRHAQPEWYQSITALLSLSSRDQHQSTSNAKRASTDTEPHQADEPRDKPNRLSALLGRVSAHPGSFVDFSKARTPAVTGHPTSRGSASTSRTSLWSVDAEKGKSSFDADAKGSKSLMSDISTYSPSSIRESGMDSLNRAVQGHERVVSALSANVSVPERALYRGYIGCLEPSGPSGQGIIDPSATGTSVQRTPMVRGGLRIETDLSKMSHAGRLVDTESVNSQTTAITSTPTRVSGLASTQRLPTSISRKEFQPVSNATCTPSTPPRPASARSSPSSPSANARSPSRLHPRTARPAMHSRHASSPALAHSPMSPSNLRKSYIPTEAEVVIATRSSLVRPVTVLLTPTLRASRPNLTSAASTPDESSLTRMDATAGVALTAGGTSRHTAPADVLDFSARHSYVAVASPTQGS